MLEDRLLIWKFKHGSADALQAIYEKYRGSMLTVAAALCNDVNTAEDVVQDCFVSFARLGRSIRSKGSLKGYLLTSVVNRVRDLHRSGRHKPGPLEYAETFGSNEPEPPTTAICNEQMQAVRGALEKLPAEQREVVVLYTRGRITFKQIAESLNLTLPTVQSRYRYGLDKLRVLLNGELKP